MNLEEALVYACEYDDLSDALTSIALWKTNNNSSVSWGECFDKVLTKHPEVILRKKDACVKMYMSKIPEVNGIFRYPGGDKYFIIVNERHGFYTDNMADAIENVENLFDVEFSVKASQGRDINTMYCSAEKIWMRSED